MIYFSKKHAKRTHVLEFCNFLFNVSIAATYLQKKIEMLQVLIYFGSILEQCLE